MRVNGISGITILIPRKSKKRIFNSDKIWFKHSMSPLEQFKLWLYIVLGVGDKGGKK